MRPLPRLEATPPVTKMCFAKTLPLISLRSPRSMSRTGTDRRRPYHATHADPRTGVRYRAGMTRVETADHRAPARRRRRGRSAHWRLDATVLAVVAILLRLPAFFADRSLVFDDGVFASSALAMRARRGAVPRRLLEPGPGVPPAALGRRPRRVPHHGRAPRAQRRRRGAAHRRGVRVRAPGHDARERAARGGARHDERVGALGDRAGERRRPVARVVGARGRVRAALPRRPARRSTRCGSGWPAGAAVSIKALSVPAVVIAGLIVLLSHRRRARRGGRGGRRDRGVRGGGAAVRASPTCGTSRTRTTRTRTGRTRTPARVEDLRHPVGPRPARRARARARGDHVRRAPGAAPPGGHARRPLAAGRRRRAGALDRAGVRAARVGAGDVAGAHRPPRPTARAARVAAAGAVVGAGDRRARRRAVLRVEQPVDPLARRLHRATRPRWSHRLERLPADALVISDDPGWVWRSGHRPPGALADTSFQRIDQGQITQASLVKAATARRRVRRDLVVAARTSGASTGSGTRSRPRATPPSEFGPRITLYERTTATARS